MVHKNMFIYIQLSLVYNICQSNESTNVDKHLKANVFEKHLMHCTVYPWKIARNLVQK